MLQLTNYLLNVVDPSQEELDAFLNKVHYKTYPKNTQLIGVNDYCDKIYFVIDGYLKFVMNINKRDTVVHISSKGNLVTDFYSYYAYKPAISCVYTITNCQLAYIHKNDLENLYSNFNVWEKFGRLVAEQAAVRLIFEKIKLQTKNNEERYLDLIDQNPELLKHIKLGDLAQTLGITQETLSRIRRRISKGK